MCLSQSGLKPSCMTCRYGFFKNKRIVLFDTLVNQCSQSQVVAVLAHELGKPFWLESSCVAMSWNQKRLPDYTGLYRSRISRMHALKRVCALSPQCTPCVFKLNFSLTLIGTKVWGLCQRFEVSVVGQSCTCVNVGMNISQMFMIGLTFELTDATIFFAPNLLCALLYWRAM